MRLGVFVLTAVLAQASVPVIANKCAGCHSGASPRGNLDVTTREALLRGGSRGPAVVPGNASASLIYKAAAHQAEPHMPMGAPKLASQDLESLAAWINSGAHFEQPVKATAPTHWAYQAPRKAQAPAGIPARWSANPVDAFVAAGHKQKNVQPVEPADPRTLIRRAYLDLTGVPPTAAQVEQFAADPSAAAYTRVVDQLLQDPRYGERWGRHWMDIWRYSDWYGWRKAGDVRFSARHIWRWRDWIVEALNSDKSYAAMIREMLAGDEIDPGNPDVVRATGFLARQYHKYDRDGWMQDAVDHTALAFLGTTLKCARCHDHKYDPLSQKEYYQFRAFFEPYNIRTDRVPGEVDVTKAGLARVFDAELDTPTYLYIRGDVKAPDRAASLDPAVPGAMGGRVAPIEPVSLPQSAYYPDNRAFVHQDLLAQAKADLERAETELRKAKESSAAAEKIQAAEKSLAAAKAFVPALQARIAADRAKFADPPDPKYEDLAAAAKKAEREAGILKADAEVFSAMLDLNEARAKAKPGSVADEKAVTAAFKRVNDAQSALTQPAGEGGYTPVGKQYPDRSSGRRLALANWIAANANPLTARVAVNHIWARHFGKPLVASVFDFGLNGKRPSHPELLDWLAVEFMESGWSMKKLHRLLLTSETYKMASTSGIGDHPSARTDPENIALWRMNSRRMEAEIVRDAILSVSGVMDPAMGGPDLDEGKGFDVYRRSIYFRHSPDTQMEFLRTFDMASPAECYERNESVVPQQALALANSKLSRDQSRALAKKIREAHPQPEAFARAAFETILGRPPTGEELPLAAKAQPENLVHVLFNHNDFITIR